MKRTITTVIVVLALLLINWVRQSADFGHIARILPFCSGREVGLYDFASLILIGLLVWGLLRLSRRDSSNDN